MIFMGTSKLSSQWMFKSEWCKNTSSTETLKQLATDHRGSDSFSFYNTFNVIYHESTQCNVFYGVVLNFVVAYYALLAQYEQVMDVIIIINMYEYEYHNQ
jgi:hypothetical protein